MEIDGLAREGRLTPALEAPEAAAVPDRARQAALRTLNRLLRWARCERLVGKALEAQLRNLLADEALDVAHVAGVFRCHECERVADRLGAAGAADPVPGGSKTTCPFACTFKARRVKILPPTCPSRPFSNSPVSNNELASGSGAWDIQVSLPFSLELHPSR